MIEGSGSIPLTKGSRRTKNTWIRGGSGSGSATVIGGKVFVSFLSYTQKILTLRLESASAAVVVVQFLRMNRSLRTFLFLGSRTAAPAPASGGCDWLVRLMMTGRSGAGAAAEAGVRSACCCCSSCCWPVTSSALLTTTKAGFILR